MNRLLRIGFDTFLTSVTPILGWFLLGILVDKNLINIFSLIYPMQFVVSAIQSIFGTGANISSIRDKNKNSVFSGVVLGSGIGLIILGCVAINIDKYITFMNMDIDTYKIFGVYAVIQMFFQLLLNLSLCKLYFEEENKRANKYSLLFNLINFSSLIIMSLITKEQIKIVGISVICMSVFVVIMMFRIVEKPKFKINIVNCIKYDSVYLFAEISMFIIYLLLFFIFVYFFHFIIYYVCLVYDLFFTNFYVLNSIIFLLCSYFIYHIFKRFDYNVISVILTTIFVIFFYNALCFCILNFFLYTNYSLLEFSVILRYFFVLNLIYSTIMYLFTKVIWNK